MPTTDPYEIHGLGSEELDVQIIIEPHDDDFRARFLPDGGAYDAMTAENVGNLIEMLSTIQRRLVVLNADERSDDSPLPSG